MMTAPGGGSCAAVGRNPDWDAAENAANSARSPAVVTTPTPPTAWPFLNNGTPPGFAAAGLPSMRSCLPVMTPRPGFAPLMERDGLIVFPGLKVAFSGQPRLVFSIP